MAMRDDLNRKTEEEGKGEKKEEDKIYRLNKIYFFDLTPVFSTLSPNKLQSPKTKMSHLK